MSSLRPIKPRPVFWLFTNFIIVMAIMTVVILVLTRICSAQSDDDTALALAQCLVAECDRCDRANERGEYTEKEAIAWVLWKGMERYNANPRNKRKRTFKDQIHAYCAVFDKRSVYYYGKRAKGIRNSTRTRTRHIRGEEWRALLDFSISFVRQPSGFTDPYQSSRHFGGILDIGGAREKGLRVLGEYRNKHGKWCTYIFG